MGDYLCAGDLSESRMAADKGSVKESVLRYGVARTLRSLGQWKKP
jgi:hypothetical protein